LVKAQLISAPARLLVAGLIAIAATPNAIAGTHIVHGLTATSHAPTARGRAALALKNASKGRFRVVARGLTPGASFDLVVGGVKVASFTTSAGGSGKVKLGTNPRPSEGLLGVDPRGKSIEVRDHNGDEDLDGDMPGDEDSGSGAFACCVPDDDGAECEIETPDECAHHNGTTVTGVDSCIPNPCSDTPSGEDEVVCCFPGGSAGASVDEESEAGCDDTSTQECAVAGGTVVAATSCEPNPCSAVPPAQVTTCCVPDGSETECEILTPDHCSAVHGTPSSATSCESDPCGGGDGGTDD
jgi:hypothetical protein